MPPACGALVATPHDPLRSRRICRQSGILAGKRCLGRNNN
jgi:hypothetical protein